MSVCALQVLRLGPAFMLLSRQIVQLPPHFLRQEWEGKSSQGGNWKWEKQVAFSPRSTSCHSQWASSVYESTKHRITSKHELVHNTAIQRRHTPDKSTQSYIKTRSLMAAFRLIHKGCPQKTCLHLLFFFFFCTCVAMWAVPETPFSAVCFCLPLRTNPQLHQGSSSRVLRKGQRVTRDPAARRCIVSEPRWLTEDKSRLVAFEKARPLH